MRRRFTDAALVLLLAAPFLAGCGKQEGERPFTVLVPVEANTLDPHFATSTIEWTILMNVMEPLIARSDGMREAPALAESWEVDGTKKVWTFRLRKGVKFQNGESFDARAVKYTFERMRDRSLRARTTVPNRIALDKVEEVDAHTVRIHTKTPIAIVPAWLVNAFILPPKYYSSTPPKEVLGKPMGTGPYRMTEWVKDSFIRMEAHEGWWGGKPRIRTVVWRPVPEASARVAELESGGADLITAISADQANLIARRKEGFQTFSIQGGRRVYIGIRTDWDAFGDARVRQAMNYAVNFELVAKQFLLGHGSRMATVVCPPNGNPQVKPYPYDPAKARALLAAAGLKDSDGDGILESNGRPLRLKLDVPVARYLQGMEIAEAAAADLRAVGIHVEVQPLEWSVFLSNRRKKALSPLYLHGFSSAFNAETDLGALRPALFANMTGWKNAEFVEGFNRLRQTFDEEERKRISDRLQELVHKEAPWIFLWNQYDFFAGSSRVEWKPRPDERIYLPAVSVKEKPAK
ncbi:MAG: ABC transporter substrate-binding protein [Candidatus Tectomicrobia bacterium]|uniref:ABC transporter substrate-binding protein n=1 Tax=Tectimicrobiota bacterium TaxID=2528274 RepID=A0A932MNW2_UNCTE|nr:ABC transporter substrate-binding protein [Candidatus Tectomicrobia bacterium]